MRGEREDDLSSSADPNESYYSCHAGLIVLLFFDPFESNLFSFVITGTTIIIIILV